MQGKCNKFDQLVTEVMLKYCTMTIVVQQVMNNLKCIFRYEIKDDTPIETKLEDKLIISETSTSLKASSKEEESTDAAEQNRLNEKQAQGMFNNDIL